MELQGKDKQELQQELSEFLLQYYDGSNQKCCIRKNTFT